MSSSMNVSNGANTFCQGSLWNQTMMWEKDVPDLTECFQTSILPAILLFTLMLFSSYEISMYISHRKKKKQTIGFNWYNITKLVIIISLLIVDIVKLCYMITVHFRPDENDVYPSNYFYVVVFLICHIISFVLLLTSLHFGLRRSFAQFLFYFLSVICDVIVLRSSILNHQNLDPMMILIGVHLTFDIMMFILSSMIDYAMGSLEKGNIKDENSCPLLSANLPSKLTFAWVTPLIWKGLQDTLQPSMLWNLHPNIMSKAATNRFEKFYKGNDYICTSILRSLIKAFGKEFGLASFIQVFVVVVSTAAPQLQKQIIIFVRHKYILKDPQAYLWKGLLFAFLLFSTALFLNICNGQYNHRIYDISLKIRASLSNSIYKKALKLSCAERNEKSVGEIVNLTELDVAMITVRYFKSRCILGCYKT